MKTKGYSPLKRFVIIIIFFLSFVQVSAAEVDTLWLRLCDYSIYDLLFTSDSKQIITCGESNDITFWDAATGKVVRTLNNGGKTSSLQLFNNDKYLLANTLNYEVGTAPKIWDLETGTVIKEMNTKIPSLLRTVISNDGKYIAAACYVYGLAIYDCQTGDTVKSFDYSHRDYKYGPINDEVHYVAISPDSKYLIFTISDCETGNLKVVDLSTMEIVYQTGVPGASDIKFSHDGKFFFVESDVIEKYQDRHEILMYDFETKKIVKSFTNDSYEIIYDFSISEDNKYLVVGNEGNDLNLFDIEKGTKIYSYNNGYPFGTYDNVEISNDNNYIVGNSYDYMLLFPFKTTTIIENEKISNSSIIQNILFNKTSNSINLTLNISKSNSTEINIIDIKGTIVSTLFNDYLEAGNKTLSFDLGNISSGTYIVNVKSGEFSEAKTIAILK